MKRFFEFVENMDGGPPTEMTVGTFVDQVKQAIESTGWPDGTKHIFLTIFQDNAKRWPAWQKEFAVDPEGWVGKKIQDWGERGIWVNTGMRLGLIDPDQLQTKPG